MKNAYPSLFQRFATLTALAAVSALPLTAAQMVTNWVAFNDHNSGAGTAANVTAYSLTQSGNVGQPAGGALVDFGTGTALGARMDVTSTGYINGTTGSSEAPNAGTPADAIFGGKIDWAASALYYGPSPYTASVIITFTNLTPGARYNFRGTAVRGNNYIGRWTVATLVGASSSTPAHIPGVGTPGIVTNGWSPYGDMLAPNLQAAWNSGENRGGEVIAWDDIVPIDNSFSVICSNFAIVVGATGAVPGGNLASTYCYAFGAVMLEEVMEMGPVELTQQPVAATNVEEYASFALTVRAGGSLPRYQWYKGELGAGVPIEGATMPTYAVSSARLADAGSYYVVVANDLNSVTSSVAQVTVYVNPLAITQQPTNRLTALQLRPFTLSVEVTGTHPFYQWEKEVGGAFVAIADATNSAYTVASASAADEGNYRVVVTNSLYAVTSTVAQVVFTTDGDPPVVLRVIGSGNNDQVIVEFDEPLNPEIGADVGNFSFNPSLDFSAAALTNNGKTVVIYTGPQDPNTVYDLAITEFDVIGNFLATNVTFVPWVPSKGGVSFEVYATGNSATAITNLTSYAGFPDTPSEAHVLPTFDTLPFWPDNTDPTNTVPNTAPNRQNYGGRMRGLFIPPFTGNWRFFIRSDDASELWFNPAGPSAEGKVRVAYETGCCNAFQEPGTATQTSTNAFPLIAGQAYYLEAIYKEGGGGDYCLVAARMDGDSTPATNLTAISFSMGYPNVPAGVSGQALVVQDPTDVTVEAPGSMTLSVLGSNSLNAPFIYQWQQSDGAGGFTNIPNAHLKTLSRTGLGVADSAQFRCLVISGDSVATSGVATVTVTPDATGPNYLSAARSMNRTNLLLTFSEVLLESSATNVANYQVCDVFTPGSCVTVWNAVLTNNGSAVLLETDEPDPTGVYQVTVANVTDTNANVVRLPHVQPLQLVLSFQQGVDGYSGTVDTHVRSDNATTTYGTSAAVLADNLSPLCHALLRFDNLFGTGAGQIAPGAAIQSAKLYLRTDNWGNDIRVHRMLTNWSGSSTWNNLGTANDGVNTNNLDAALPVEFTFATVAVGTVVELDVTASVRWWATNGGPNYGWVFIDTGDDGYQFNSSEATDVSQRPRLVVSYTPDTVLHPVQIVGEPAPLQTVNEGQNASFTVSVTGTRPEVQWYKDGVLIPGATALTLTLTNLVETNSGRYYCVVTNLAPSQVQSADAVLVVNPETNAPTVVSANISAVGVTTITHVDVTFSKAVDPATATVLGNYTLTSAFGGPAVTLTGAALSANGRTVTLTTDGQSPITYYRLTVQNVTDTAYRHNVMAPNPTTLFVGYRAALITGISEWKYYEAGDIGTTTWTAPAFDDSGWSNGMSLFVAKSGTPGAGDLPVTTNLVYGRTTYYFRQHFTMPASNALAGLQTYQLQARPIVDDGAVFHINAETTDAFAYRLGMTNAGPIDYNTLAIRTMGNDYRFEGPYALPTTNVVFGGDNVMAVEVHQVSTTSSDVAFAMELLVTAPPLEVRIVPSAAAGGSWQLTWPPVAGWRLYESDTVEGPYSPVAGNPQGSYNVPLTQGARKFYQVRSE